MLLALDLHSIGWTHQIRQKLTEYNLEDNFENIGLKSENEWKNMVKVTVEKRHKNKLIDDCHSVGGGCLHEKTKTKCITRYVKGDEYSRARDFGVVGLTRMKAKAIIMGRYGMLDCANNYEGKYGSRNWDLCGVTDDETHRVNNCEKWRDINHFSSDEKIDFGSVHSVVKEDLEGISAVILSIWDLKNGKNCMVKIEAN